MCGCLTVLMVSLFFGSLKIYAVEEGAQYQVQNSYRLMNRANELYQKGMFKKAIILYKKTLQRGGAGEAIAFNIGNCYFRLGDFSKSAASYKRALRLSKGKNEAALMNLAGVLFRLGEYGPAIAAYRRYLKSDPSMVSAWLYLADAYARTGDLISSQLALEKAQRLEPLDVSILYQLSETHVTLGEYERAIELIEQAYAQNPEETDFLFYVGDLYRTQNDFTGAASSYRKGLAIEPENVDVLYKLADVLEQDGKLFLAMDCLQKALVQKTDFTDAAIFLGNLSFDLKMWDRSQSAYIKALSLKNLEGIEGIRNIAFEYQKLGQVNESVKLIQKALHLVGTNSDLQTDLVLYQNQIE